MCNKVELEGVEVDANGRSANDRPGDPLFPIMPAILAALRSRAAENESTTTDEYSLLIESICGATDDSQAVEQYNGSLGVTTAFVAANQSAVGQIQWNTNLAAAYTNPGTVNGARWCSGTMISDDLFLTAGHCFDQTGGNWERPRVNGTTNIIPSTEIATNMHVNFNFQVDAAGNPRTETSFPILQLVEYRLGGLDFAIVRLGGNPGATWGRTPIATNDAVAGDMLTIIGHPAGQRKRIEAGPALAPSGSMIRYDDIDTLGGNSGSGVLRASDGRIVGVHTNGGCGPTSPGDGNSNFGQRIVSVIAASPTLQALTRPKLKFQDDVNTNLAADLTTTLAAADQIGTLKFRDDLQTNRALDLGTTIRGADQPPKFKAVDDVKMPVLDKNPRSDIAKLPGADWGPFNPGGPVINPAFGRGIRPETGAQPFILATPHHSYAWQQGQENSVEAQAAAAYEDALQQLMAAMAQAEAQLQAMDAQYRQLLDEYTQLTGQSG